MKILTKKPQTCSFQGCTQWRLYKPKPACASILWDVCNSSDYRPNLKIMSSILNACTGLTDYVQQIFFSIHKIIISLSSNTKQTPKNKQKKKPRVNILQSSSSLKYLYTSEEFFPENSYWNFTAYIHFLLEWCIWSLLLNSLEQALCFLIFISRPRGPCP